MAMRGLRMGLNDRRATARVEAVEAGDVEAKRTKVRDANMIVFECGFGVRVCGGMCGCGMLDAGCRCECECEWMQWLMLYMYGLFSTFLPLIYLAVRP